MKQAIAFIILVVFTMLLRVANSTATSRHELLWRHRNLGKALYENPTTKLQAVEEFRKALELAPHSARDRLDYGLALLRAGKIEAGVAELQKVQKQDPTNPQTWFNLGIVYERQSKNKDAILQFQGMIRLVPNEPVSHFNLGTLYQLTGKRDLALKEYKTAERLNPGLAGPHFRLYNAYRQAGNKIEAAREYELFKEIKRQQANAAVPEDLEWSAYSEIYDTLKRGEEKEITPVPIRLQAHKVGRVGDGTSAGLLVFDSQGKGNSDLLVWSTDGVQLFRGGTSLVSDTGLEKLQGVVSIAAGDFNNDGLPDLCVLTSGHAALYVNRKGIFEPSPTKLPAGKFTKALWLDYDHDYDQDLFLFGKKPVLLRNEGTAGFLDRTSRFPFVPGRPLDVTRFELHPDNQERDVIVTYEDRTATLYLDRQGGHYEALPLDQVPSATSSIVAFDLNNDGWMDLITAANGVSILANQKGKLQKPTTLSKAGPPFGIVDFENRGVGALAVGGKIFENNSGHFEAVHTIIPKARALAAADFDGDGRVDLALVTPEGALEILQNETVSAHHWIGVQVRGVKNLKLAPGTTVEVKAGTVYEKRIYAGVPLSFGLRNQTSVDTIRITWPNGLVQNELHPRVDGINSYKEKPRLSGSCPMVFAWNGNKFAFVADVLGVAPLGASDGDGHYFPVNHREYVKIPAQDLRSDKQSYQLRITEELREVSYLDQVQLVAIDHTADLEVFTNDKFKGPPFPKFRMYGIKNKIYPRSALDEHGRNLLPQIDCNDKTYAAGFRRDDAGVAEMHSIELDFGDAAPDNRAILVLRGWVDWPDASTFSAAAQQGRELVFPFLQTKDSAGHWHTVIKDMGIPSGKPRTIIVNLTGKFLSRSRSVRILTNLCVYWDEIYLSEENATPHFRTTVISPNRANLHFRGFSRLVRDPDRSHPEHFVYGKVSSVSNWNPIHGFYTRYGAVRRLLLAEDDLMVIMGSGDELQLSFDAVKLPSLPAGWTRDFFIFVDGWAKDGDSNTAFSQSVEPLPFHGMRAYPYPKGQHFPHNRLHQEYRSKYLTRPALRLLRPLAADSTVRQHNLQAHSEEQP